MTQFIEKTKIDEYLNDLRQGNSSALDSLYESTSRKIYALCYTYMKNQHDSEDALSETYMSIVRSIDKFKGKNGFNWIYTIAKNVCLNLLRRQKREVPVDCDDEETVNVLGISGETEITCYDESGIIALSQRALNENEFRIVVLHAVNGLKFKEIARLTDSKEATVRWQYNNAIAKVKKEYERGSAL